MHAQYTENELIFQSEVRKFMESKFTPELSKRIRKTETFREATIEWQKILDAQGWAVNGWPVNLGGCGWSATKKYIFNCEVARAGAPEVIPMGIKMVAPVIYTFGTEEQQKRFLPSIKSSDIWWCQGYSEPGAGSDLASLKTRAVRSGDHYIINGSKIWTTYAHQADWIFCLVRTSSEGRVQQGITFLLIDMKSPGIEVKPIISIDGEHHFNEVFFTDVSVPVENRIGEENRGWDYAKALLNHERTALSGVAVCKVLLEEAKTLLSGVYKDFCVPLSSDLKSRIADVEIDLMALEFLELSILNKLDRGGTPGVEASLLKLKGTELQQSVQSLCWDITGGYAGVAAFAEDGSIESDFLVRANQIRRDYMYGRAATIYGGSNEIQKNIIAKYGLGL
jgi:alkylation response protein AidB-like acyl-CoA dehydrogenase